MRISDWSSDVCSSDLDLVPCLEVWKGVGDRRRVLDTEDREAARRQREDRIFVAGPTAKKAVAVILDDDQRELLARRAIWWQPEIARSRQPEIVEMGKAAGRERGGKYV